MLIKITMFLIEWEPVDNNIVFISRIIIVTLANILKSQIIKNINNYKKYHNLIQLAWLLMIQ